MNEIKELLNIIYMDISSIYKDQISQSLKQFIKRTNEKIKLCFYKKRNIIEISKWEVFYVHLWYNIWDEIMKTRPCVVISQKHANLWDMILIAPLTSAYDELWSIKKKDWRFFVFVPKDQNNLLKNDSYISLTQIRFISKNRLDNKISNLSQEILIKIDKKISKIIWIKNPT